MCVQSYNREKKSFFDRFILFCLSLYFVFTWSVIQRNSFKINANSYSDEPKHDCGYWLLIRVSAMVPMLSSLSPLQKKCWKWKKNETQKVEFVRQTMTWHSMVKWTLNTDVIDVYGKNTKIIFTISEHVPVDSSIVCWLLNKCWATVIASKIVINIQNVGKQWLWWATKIFISRWQRIRIHMVHLTLLL